MEYYARFDKDGKPQLLTDHLNAVSELCSEFLNSIGLSESGKLIGLLHDLGKYNEEFQYYLLSNCGFIKPGEPNYRKPEPKIDHATVGAQFCNEILKEHLPVKDTLEMAMIAHHGGLYDMIDKTGGTPFHERLNKVLKQKSGSLAAIKDNAEPKILKEAQKIIDSKQIAGEFEPIYRYIEKIKSAEAQCMFCYLLLRFVYSSLIDADRTNAAGRKVAKPIKWGKHVAIIEKKMSEFNHDSEISKIRAQISQQCLEFADEPFETVKLTVPTGGGKTLSSLRFAVNYAHKHAKKRIFYILPYTSIIEQNAKVTREFLDVEGTANGAVVLEHHSNILPENDSEFAKMVAENWDAPIVYTTMVQLLNALFSAKSKSARRFHNLADSVIIFDEIQSIPLKVIHLFNNAMNFLTQVCNSSVVLCSATQPILDRVDDSKGAIKLSNPADMIEDSLALFQNLKRTEVKYAPELNSLNKLADFIKEKAIQHKSLLTIVNTKKVARDLFNQCRDKNITTIHLSTNMCPKHRTDTLDEIKKLLGAKERVKPLLVISTQLIEAGVDISFASVVRMMAGFDSIAQAAGRCNRNMENPDGLGPVYIVDNINGYKLPSEIDKAAVITARIIEDFNQRASDFDHNLLHPGLMELYYRYFLFERRDEMNYPIKSENTNLLDLFSLNSKAFREFRRSGKARGGIGLTGAYRTAGEHFEPIEDFGDEGIIVLYQGSEKLVEQMCSGVDPKTFFNLLRQAQQYSVNISETTKRALLKKSVINKIAADVEVYFLDKNYYDLELGITLDGALMETLNI